MCMRYSRSKDLIAIKVSDIHHFFQIARGVPCMMLWYGSRSHLHFVWATPHPMHKKITVDIKVPLHWNESHASLWIPASPNVKTDHVTTTELPEKKHCKISWRRAYWLRFPPGMNKAQCDEHYAPAWQFCASSILLMLPLSSRTCVQHPSDNGKSAYGDWALIP